MADSSVLENVLQLCDIHLGPVKRSYRVQPATSRFDAKRKLKNVAFDALFKYLKNPAIEDDSDLQDVESIQLEIFKLRRLNKFEDADRLENLFNKLKESDICQELNQVLRFMIALKDCNKSFTTPTPPAPFQYSCIPRGKLPAPVSEGPLCYGDARLTSSYSHYYMYFPNELFEKVFPPIMNIEESMYRKVFNNSLGECLDSDHTFSHQLLLGTPHEVSTHTSLFGGLSQSLTTGLNISLDLPDLQGSPQFSIPDFKCKKSDSLSQLSEESGLGSGSGSMVGSSTNLPEYSHVDDTLIWEKALTDARSQHYTWEWISYQPGPTEKPYLTESGPNTYNILIHLRHRVCSMLVDAPATQFTTVDTTTLVKHVLYMLNGVPSVFFPFDKSTQTFHILPGLHTTGFTPDLLANFLSDFADCGSFHVRLTHFSQPLVLNSFYTDGLVFQAFISAIRKVLKYFTAEVLNAPEDLQLIQLKVYFHKAMSHIRYLAKLCHCHDKPPPSVPPGQFATGMQLISYLYNETSVAISSPHYTILLSILQTACAPFMLFIRDWAFHGVFTDCYKEFMISADHFCIETRDETYWEKAYSLLSGEHDQSDIPEFIVDMAQDIVTCGKSINLLRICNPKHFMCNLSASELPSVTLSLSLHDLEATGKYCQAYSGRMAETSRQWGEGRAETLQRLELEKLELQQTAKAIADQEIARLQGIIDERKRKEEEKKTVERKRLKQQMEDDLKRRADEVEELKEEDRRFQARLNREEDALTQQEIYLEKKTRDDLIAYYTELGAEAMHRERVALWRVRRARLQEARVEYIEAQEERWRREVEEARQGQLILDSVKPSILPLWVGKAEEVGQSIDEAQKEDANLPSWARVSSSGTDQNQQDLLLIREINEGKEKETLPNWVQRAIDDGECGTMKVVDDEDVLVDINSDEEQEVEKDKIAALDKSLRIIGGTPLQKPQVRKSADSHVSHETTESLSKPHLRAVNGKNITDLSEENSDSRPHVKTVGNSNILQESQPQPEIFHTKTSSSMSATKESESFSDEAKLHLKFREDIQVNQQSTEQRHLIPHRGGQGLHSITQETDSEEWLVKKPNVFGHASQLSNTDYQLSVPRLRKFRTKHANIESSYKDFSIKPKIRINSKMSANAESESSEFRPSVRVVSNRHVSTESTRVDEHARAIERFKLRNIKGHTSDSSVQKLLYGDKNLENVKDQNEEPLPRVELIPGPPRQPEKYQTENFGFDLEPEVDLMANIQVVDLGRGLIEESTPSEAEIEVTKYTPLSVLLKKSLTTPIKAQISLVNTAVINYFTSELKVDDHFKAIRRYLLMCDGDFAEILSNILLEKLATNPLPHEILNSVFLNGALTKAIRSSIHSDDVYTQNLSFATRFMPNVLMPNEPNSLKCLELRYKVNWPLNIIITKACMEKYYRIFSFLLQIKRMVWVLKDIWNHLKRDALINEVGNSTEFRHLQFHRQEMEHFVQMMQGYITTQVIHVSWQEFQSALESPNAGLDHLHRLHDTYISNALARCLLAKKTEKVMKFIQDIFCLILKFRSQLITGTWQRRHDDVRHSNFDAMTATYKSFHTYSFFLFKVVNRLSLKGYQPHLQELLLQLNFNDFYTEASN